MSGSHELLPPRQHYSPSFFPVSPVPATCKSSHRSSQVLPLHLCLLSPLAGISQSFLSSHFLIPHWTRIGSMLSFQKLFLILSGKNTRSIRVFWILIALWAMKISLFWIFVSLMVFVCFYFYSNVFIFFSLLV